MGSFEEWWNADLLPRDEGRLHELVPKANRELLFINNHGSRFLRTARDVEITYTVTRKAWLGYFTPEQCRGVIDYLQGGAFFASYLPIGQIPVERGSDWPALEDVDRLAVTVRGTIATAEGWHITERLATIPNEAYQWERMELSQHQGVPANHAENPGGSSDGAGEHRG
jgi:hypothetical protein